MTKDGVFWGTLFIFGVGVNITMVGFTIKCVDWTGINWDLGENVRPLFDSSFIFGGVCFGDSNKIYNYRIIMVYTDNYMIFGCAQRSKTWGYGIPHEFRTPICNACNAQTLRMTKEISVSRDMPSRMCESFCAAHAHLAAVLNCRTVVTLMP